MKHISVMHTKSHCEYNFHIINLKISMTLSDACTESKQLLFSNLAFSNG